MRILCLTHRLPYAPNRGDRVRAYHLIRLLAAKHDVDLVSLVHDDEEMSHLPDLQGVAASTTGVRTSPLRSVVTSALALPGPRPLTHVLLHGPRMGQVLRQRVADARPDVVLAYCSGMARYAVEPPLSEIPFVFDMVDVDSEKWAELARTARWPRRWIYQRETDRLRLFERYAMNRASATTVVNERERTLLGVTATGHDAVVVPNGVDLAGLARGRRPLEDRRQVVFCGVFNYGPNEDGALWMGREVWPLVRKVDAKAQFVLVGMNPTRAVRALADDPSIRVTGAVADVRPYLWESAAAVAPVRIARGVQNKVLEAVAAGLPCVVTPQVLDGLPAAVRPACVSAGDARAFADAIIRWLNMSQEGRSVIVDRADLSGLSWERQLSPFLDLVRRAEKSADSAPGRQAAPRFGEPMRTSATRTG